MELQGLVAEFMSDLSELEPWRQGASLMCAATATSKSQLQGIMKAVNVVFAS